MTSVRPPIRHPFVDATTVGRLAAEYPTPFHLYDEAGIRTAARQLQAAFAWNPGFREYFAVKANPNPAVLRILHEEGCGLDCSSLTELMLAERLGLRGTDIMFSSNVTPREDFQLARRLEATINLDDISHIGVLSDVAGLPNTISCRFNPGESFSIGNAIMSNPAEAKYGFTRAQLPEGFRQLRARGVRRFGLHAFLASNCLEADYYPALARLLFETAAWLGDETGAAIEFVNLSGGLGIPYRPEDRSVDIEATGEAVRQAFDTILRPAGLGHVSIFAELGRWLTGPHGCLVARVIHEKHIHRDYVGLDACAANLMRPAMYGAYHHITVAGKETAAATRRYDVTGGLCENNDKFAIARDLPEIEVGDLLVIHDTGAHGFSMGYNYNGKLRSAEVLLCTDGTSRLIRRAETPEDYFATVEGVSL